MINFHDYTNETKTEHYLKWPYIPHVLDQENKCIIEFNKQSARY